MAAMTHGRKTGGLTLEQLEKLKHGLMSYIVWIIIITLLYYYHDIYGNLFF